MEDFIEEIRAAIKGQAWLLALAGVLALPDMCAALESNDGCTTGAKYRSWVSRWLGNKYTSLDPADLYQMRCSFLHQGHARSRTYERIIFTGVDRNVVMNNNTINEALNLDLPTFCKDIIDGVLKWQETMADNENYEKNIGNLIQWHPTGLAPYIVGVPVLS